MATLIMVCGPVAAGKTSYSIKLAEQLAAVRFSIDPWMQTLFAEDMPSLDFSWIMKRVARCHQQIWEISQQILALDGKVILDLGFTTQAQRQDFVAKAATLNITPELHYLDVPQAQRKQQLQQRNQDKDPQLYSFEVTEMMFDFMEPRFEVPSADELKHGRTVKP